MQSKFEVEFKRLMDEVERKRLEKEQDKPMVDRFTAAAIGLELTYPGIYAASMLEYYKGYVKMSSFSPEESQQLSVVCLAMSQGIFDKRLIANGIKSMLEFNPSVVNTGK